MKPKTTMQQLIAASVSESITPPEEGFKTIAGWVETMPEYSQISQSRAHRSVSIIMKKLVEDGKVETKKYRIKCGNTVRSTAHYRVI